MLDTFRPIAPAGIGRRQSIVPYLSRSYDDPVAGGALACALLSGASRRAPVAKRIRIPLLLDVGVVDNAAEMAWFNGCPDVTRVPSPSGGLVHRVLHRRVAGTLRVGSDLLPAFTARDDQRRAARQAALETDLGKVDLDREPLVSDVRALANYVTGHALGLSLGAAVQQLVGRLFLPGYTATEESYRAAQVIAEWPRANPLKALWWRWSGRLARSRSLIWTKAGNDPACIHATAIAMHNLVTAVERMRELARNIATRELSPRQAVQASLAAPPAVLRSALRPLAVPFLARPLRTGTLIVFRLEKIHAGARDEALAFLRGEWSQCPAHKLVPWLLAEVWAAGTAANGRQR